MINLIRRLPADSELHREIHGESASWSRQDHLSAIIADRVAELGWIYAAAHSENEPDRPEPIPRPGVDAVEAVPASSNADIAAFMSS